MYGTYWIERNFLHLALHDQLHLFTVSHHFHSCQDSHVQAGRGSEASYTLQIGRRSKAMLGWETSMEYFRLKELPECFSFLFQGWSGAFRDAIFGGDGRDKKCEAYYEVSK